jgi:hypothetical protein
MVTDEEILESELSHYARERREPNITFRQLVDMFGDDEDAKKLAKKQIRSLTIRRNKIIKPSLIIDKNLRWVIDEVNKLTAEPLEKQIKFYTNFLATAEADKTKPDGSVTEFQIEQAREYPIVELLESFGVEFRNEFASCPWHSERTNSLHYIRNRNTVYCHGCQKHADTITVVRHFKGAGFIEAVRSLI